MNHINPWDIEDIQVDIQRNADFYDKFSIYGNSNFIQSSNLDDFIDEIKKSKIDTGIMIFGMKINRIHIYLFILDNRVFIIN